MIENEKAPERAPTFFEARHLFLRLNWQPASAGVCSGHNWPKDVPTRRLQEYPNAHTPIRTKNQTSGDNRHQTSVEETDV
jgi:hypothetical protein